MIYAENVFICMVIPLGIAALFLKKGARSFCVALITGMVVCLLSAYVSGFFADYYSYDTRSAALFITPVTEELFILLSLLPPILLELAPETLLLIALGCGAGFATLENCCYLLNVGAEDLTFTLIRGIAVGVMHIICALLQGSGLVLMRRRRLISVGGVLGVYAIAVTFHASYNLLVSVSGTLSMIGYCLPVVSAALIWLAYHLKKKN